MSKIINMDPPTSVTFGSLNEGEMFYKHGSLFLKTVKVNHADSCATMNAVYVSDGDWSFFCDCEEVEPVDVEINVRRQN